MALLDGGGGVGEPGTALLEGDPLQEHNRKENNNANVVDIWLRFILPPAELGILNHQAGLGFSTFSCAARLISLLQAKTS